MLKLLAIKSGKINHRGQMNVVADGTHPHSMEGPRRVMSPHWKARANG